MQPLNKAEEDNEDDDMMIIVMVIVILVIIAAYIPDRLFQLIVNAAERMLNLI